MANNAQVEETLIELVRERPHLYDRKNQGYKDRIKKTNAFNEIGKELNLTGTEAKNLWEKLRKQYTNYLAKLKQPSGSGLTNGPYYRHSGAMSFYQSFYKPYKNYSNIEVHDDDLAERTPEGNLNDDQEFNDNVSILEDDSEPGNQDEDTTQGRDARSTPGLDAQHQQANARTPHVPKTREGRKRGAPLDNFDERFFAALEKSAEGQGDEYDHFGASIAGRLRKLAQKDPRLSALCQVELQSQMANFEIQAIATTVQMSQP